MSATMMPPGPPQGPPGMPPQGNVVPFPAPPQAPPPQPNPEYQKWMRLYQQRQAIVAENDKKQREFDAAVALIKKDGLSGFRLDIETDSTIAPDEMAEKQARIEFMQQFIPLMQNVAPLAKGNPALAALAKEAVLFAVRGFRVARPMEETIEQAFDAMGKMPPEPEKGATGKAPPDPKIEMAKVDADRHDSDRKAEAQMAATQQRQQQAAIQAQVKMADIQERREDNQSDIAVAMAELQQRQIAEQQRARADAAKVAAKGLE